MQYNRKRKQFLLLRENIDCVWEVCKREGCVRSFKTGRGAYD